MKIKSGCIFINWVSQQSTDSSLFSNYESASNSILEKASANANALILQRNGKPGKQNHGNRLQPHALANSRRRFNGIHLSDRQAEVAGNLITVGYD